MTEKTDAPGQRRQQKGYGGQPKHLDKQIRKRGTGKAEPVLGRVAGGMIEAGVVDIPGGQGNRAQCYQHQDDEADYLAETPSQEQPKALRQQG